MKKNLWQIIIPIALVIVTLVVYSVSSRDKEKEPDVVRVEKGTFEIVVEGMGELEALESTQIMIPDVLADRSVRIRHIEINDLVREGTVVKKGDYVATLDPGDVEDRIRNAEANYEMFKNNLVNAKIDSSLVLSETRDEIRQANDLVLDQELRVEQSAYESVAVQRQAQISLETARRALEQKKRNYIQIQRRHELYAQRAEESLQEEKEQLEVLQQLKKDLRITAPGDGLVVYARGHNGEKVKVGSHVSRWNPLIATLPDLATLQSVVYVKEIDISKIEPGLPVRVGIDAFPEEVFRGVVTRVANVGQAVSDAFHSAFKVEIKVDPNGKVLLPGMTSTNNIVVESVNEALMVPRLAVFSDAEMDYYVFKRDGISGVSQQEIKTAGENDSFYWVEAGLEAGDRVIMHPPKSTEKLKTLFLE
jgi:HlyD family secretion protein